MHKTTLTVLEGWAHPGQSARVGVSPEKRPRGVHLLTSDPVALLYHMAKGSQAADEVQLPISQSANQRWGVIPDCLVDTT